MSGATIASLGCPTLIDRAGGAYGTSGVDRQRHRYQRGDRPWAGYRRFTDPEGHE